MYFSLYFFRPPSDILDNIEAKTKLTDEAEACVNALATARIQSCFPGDGSGSVSGTSIKLCGDACRPAVMKLGECSFLGSYAGESWVGEALVASMYLGALPASPLPHPLRPCLTLRHASPYASIRYHTRSSRLRAACDTTDVFMILIYMCKSSNWDAAGQHGAVDV